MANNDTKICKMCQQPINKLARKCPYCHHWQNKISMIITHPNFFALPFMGIILFLFLFFLHEIFSPGADFNLYKDQIAISDTKLDFGENDCGQTLVIIGRIKNSGKIAWEKPRFEATFYDSTQTLFDTSQDEEYNLLISSKREMPFKVVFAKNFPKERYVEFKLKIIDAKEKGKFF